MSRRAFSLVEMIVVLGILTVLLAILMPVVGSARDAANGTLCASHIKSLTVAFIAFAADHDGHLPGGQRNVWDNPGDDPSHFDWLFGKYSEFALQQGTGPGSGNTQNTDGTVSIGIANLRKQLLTAPQYGTIWPYINNSSYSQTDVASGGSYQTYLCPSLTTSIPGQGLGSNGHFDYAVFGRFNGASIRNIAPTSMLHYVWNDTTNASNPYPMSQDPRWLAQYTWGTTTFTRQWTTQYQILPTPLVCQEDSRYWINSNLEGSHGGPDRMTHIHHGGSYYGSPTGEVTWVNEPDVTLNQIWEEGCFLWETVPPSGKAPVVLDGDGGWNSWSNY